MQKWSPEPFDIAPAAPTGVAVAEKFESDAAEPGQTDPARTFRREAGFSDTRALMNSLTAEERAQVYELVELELEEGYRERETELQAELDARLAEVRAETAASAAEWSRRIADVIAAEMREASAAAARLAVEIAGKIVRAQVAVDPEVLARLVETTLFKVTESHPIIVQAHPTEAAWLEDQEGLRKHLNIGQVVADRRIEAGGAVIRCGGREWDATLGRQLDTIAEIVGEAIATEAGRPATLPAMEDGPAPAPAPDGPTTPDTEDPHEPGVG